MLDSLKNKQAPTDTGLRELLRTCIDEATKNPQQEVGGMFWYSPDGELVLDIYPNRSRTPEMKYSHDIQAEARRHLAGWQVAAYWHSHTASDTFYPSEEDFSQILVCAVPWILVYPNTYDKIIYLEGGFSTDGSVTSDWHFVEGIGLKPAVTSRQDDSAKSARPKRRRRSRNTLKTLA